MSSEERMLKIGNGFDSAYKKRKSYKMFKESLTVAQDNASSFKFNSYVFTNNEDYRRKFSSSMSFGVNVASSPGVNFMVNFSDELTKDRDTVIYIIHALGIKRTEIAELNVDMFEGDERLKKAIKDLEKNPIHFLSKYGDSYVSSIFYGKEIALIIKYDKNVFKKNSSLGVKGEVVSIPAINAGSIDATMKFFSSLGGKNAACKIYFHTVGIDQTQLPKNNTSIEDWFVWLKDFEQNFNRTPDEKFESNVGYELESYSSIFPKETIVIMPHVVCRAIYLFSYIQTAAAIDFYIRYYEKWLGEPSKAKEFHDMKQQLEGIRAYLGQNVNVDQDNKILQFKQLIEKLNNITPEPKQLNVIHSSGFVSSMQGKLTCQDQRVSRPSFGVPSDLPAELFAFSFEVVTESKKEIKGCLSFEYSKECQVSFDKTTYNFVGNLNVDSKSENLIKVPTDLKKYIQNSYLAFHYEMKKTRMLDSMKEYFSCVQCSEIEEFSVHTYVWCEKPSMIQSIPDPEPLKYKRSDELDSSPKSDNDLELLKPLPLTLSVPNRAAMRGVLEHTSSSASIASNNNYNHGFIRNRSQSYDSRSGKISRSHSFS